MNDPSRSRERHDEASPPVVEPRDPSEPPSPGYGPANIVHYEFKNTENINNGLQFTETKPLGLV